MTDAVFTVRVVLDGDDDTGLAATNVYIRLKGALIEMQQGGQVRAFEVVREP